MNVGLAAMFIKLEDVDPAAFDLEARRKKLAENKRESLSVTQLLQFINQEHTHTVLTFQWLNTLVRYVPQLSQLKSRVSELYRTRAAKFQLPIHPSKVGCYQTTHVPRLPLPMTHDIPILFRYTIITNICTYAET
ncbi:hypothetical protein OG21DRAFT_1489955 [Imleria badia]|nr:hypothetical protein OG21DRAFT_1489955 [Imleria badia]